jgi:hypothetical protein
MLFELRRYTAQPGRRDDLVRLMEEEIIPFQVSKGVVIVGTFVDEEDPDVFIWLRRFNDEAHRVALYEVVYQSDFWKNDIAPRVPELLDRESIRVTRLAPTGTSVIH